MAPPHELTVDLVDPASSTDAALVGTLADLVNRAYAVSEEGLWQGDAARTSPDEISGLIVAGELLVARTPDGGVVGCVRCHDVAADTSEFGLLAASSDARPPRHRSGVGRRRRAAEP